MAKFKGTEEERLQRDRMREKQRGGRVGIGPPCPRCGQPTELRARSRVRQKHLKQKGYYAYWYCCIMPECPTTLIMPREGLVVNELVKERSVGLGD